MSRKKKKPIQEEKSKMTTVFSAKDLSFKSSLVEALKHINLAESYTSLLLGLGVVIVSLVLAITIIKQRQAPLIQSTSSVQTQNTVLGKADLQKTYTIQEGDTLKTVSKNVYGSEDLYLVIAKANHIENLDIITTGQVLNTPKIDKTKNAMQDETILEKITGGEYAVVGGDLLWNLSVRAYNDGNRWKDIAKANGLDNSDQLAPGVALIIPR